MAQRATLDPTIKKNLEEYLHLLKSEGVDVKNLLVYGSFAKGEAKDHSDIDVCVVSPDFGEDQTAEMVRLNILAHKIDPRIEAVPYSPADLVVEEDPLAYEIRKYGREIKI